LTEDRIREYIGKRQSKGISGRTINMELAELSRAIGKTWRELWPKVRKLEERKDTGKALSSEEQDRLLDAARDSKSPHLRTFVPLLLLFGMRREEALRLTWGQLDLQTNTVRVGRAKTSSGTGRIIPLAPELQTVLEAHKRDWTAWWNEPQPEHFVFVSSK